jgi:PHB/PHA accumulation regulator DNA-binding domain
MRASYNESNGDRSAGVDVEVREVRRYPNRRMYDARSKSYVALDEIARWIDAGERVRVLDLKTNEDVTITVLLPLLAARMAETLRGDDGAALLHRWLREGIAHTPPVPTAGDEPHATTAPPDEDRFARLEARIQWLEAQFRHGG